MANSQGFLPRCIHSSCSHESLKKIPLQKVSNTTNQNHAREPKLERDDRRRGIERRCLREELDGDGRSGKNRSERCFPAKMAMAAVLSVLGGGEGMAGAKKGLGRVQGNSEEVWRV